MGASAIVMRTYLIARTIVPEQVNKNAREISESKLLRGTLLKPRICQLVLL